MTARRLATVIASLCLLAVAGWADVPPWQTDLAYSGGGFWALRVPVTVYNDGDVDVGGAPVELTVGSGAGQLPLVGQPAESIRAVDAEGREIKCGVLAADGQRKTTGALAAGDTVILPAEVPAGGSEAIYVYAGNPKAWAPPESFGARFTNGGFERGRGKLPVGWSAGATDSKHRMYWQEGGARTGRYCVRCEVDEGAKATWVQFRQGGVPVVVGDKYRFVGWVKGRNVKGKAGWYVHVSGEKPLMVNVVEGYSGTFDWRKVTIEFTVPRGGVTFTCGTVLYGTGTAWYDDAELIRLGASRLRAKVGTLERMELKRMGAGDKWPRWREWKWRVPVVARNVSDRPLRGVLTVDWHRPAAIVARYAGWRYDLPVRLEAPGAEGPLPAGLAHRRLMAVVEVPARSELVVNAYIADKAQARGASSSLGLADLTALPTNLVKNGDMEQPGEGGVAAEGWPSGEEGGPGGRRFTVRRVRGGVHGKWCLELNVPKTMRNIGWVGSRQKVPVKPNTTYILAGFIKCRDLDSSTCIYAHLLRADGSLCRTRKYIGTSPSISGTTGWTFTSTEVTTPPDCRFIEVHLTMRARGTLWHDAVSVVEAVEGQAGAVQARYGRPRGLQAWVVNPQMKVFPDDVFPEGTDKEARLYACRNEYEPLQIAVRSSTGGRLRVRAGALVGPGGARIAPPAVYENRYVPVDFPLGYDSSNEPAWVRHKPKHRGNDGWAGWWPDPLAPVRGGAVDIAPDRTTPLWLDYRVPAEARPGDYRGAVELRLGRTTVSVPVRLRVWPYTIPARKHTFAIYDLRLRDHSYENVSKWYRFMARYNVWPGSVIPQPKFTYENGRVKINFTDFDRSAELLFDKLKCNVCYTPGFFYAFGWGYPPKKLFGVEPLTPEWNRIFQSALQQFFAHLRERGWDRYFVYYVSDEPDRRDEAVQERLARICDLAREAVPSLWVYSSTWVHLPRLDDHLNVWGIGPHGTWSSEELAARRKAGDRFWFTTDGHICLDTPYLGIERLLPWLCFKYGVEGYEFWGVNWWTYDPWKYGWHSYHLQSHAGKVFHWVRYPNGDGYLAYPGEDVGLDEPAPSIRLVAAREGIEDFELFYALRQAAAKASSGAGARQAREALGRAERVVEIPNRGGRYSSYIMPDPQAVTQARIAAGEALARLLQGR